MGDGKAEGTQSRGISFLAQVNYVCVRDLYNEEISLLSLPQRQ